MIKAVNEPEGSFLVAPAQTGRREKSDAGMGNDHCRCTLYDRDFYRVLYYGEKSDGINRIPNRAVRAKSKQA